MIAEIVAFAAMCWMYRGGIISSCSRVGIAGKGLQGRIAVSFTRNPAPRVLERDMTSLLILHC